MIVTVENNMITVDDPTASLTTRVHEELKYTDKSKKYQLRRMAKNPWSRTSAFYKKLQQEVEGILYTELGNRLAFSSCFYDQFEDEFTGHNIIDKRTVTGKTIVLPWLKKPHSLRDYQQEAVDEMVTSPRGLVNFATGLGKTLVAVYLVKQLKKRSLIVCPSEAIAKQFHEILVSAFGSNKIGFYGAGKKKLNDITVGIAASVCKDVAIFAQHELGVVIIDETHHTPATTFFDIASGLGNTGKIFGLTATDYRSDGKDVMITAGCGPVLLRRDIKWGVENGWLAEPVFLVREIPTRGKDYKDDKLRSYKEHVLNNPVMKTRIESDARVMMAAGKSVLILVDEVAHGRELSAALGIPFATGMDKKSVSYLDLLNAGKIPGLVGTDGKISEGADTRNVDVLVLANFAASRGPVMQAIGRGLRKQGTKTKCLILDYKPLGSTMLSRHADNRIGYYRDITEKVQIISV